MRRAGRGGLAHERRLDDFGDQAELRRAAAGRLERQTIGRDQTGSRRDRRPGRRASASPEGCPARPRSRCSRSEGASPSQSPAAHERLADLSRRGRIGDARSRSDGGQIVADHVRHDVAAHAARVREAAREPAALQRVNRLRTRFIALMSRPDRSSRA